VRSVEATTAAAIVLDYEALVLLAVARLDPYRS